MTVSLSALNITTRKPVNSFSPETGWFMALCKKETPAEAGVQENII